MSNAVRQCFEHSFRLPKPANSTTYYAPGSQSSNAAPPRTFRYVLRELADDARTTVEKGRSFELLVKAFLVQDKAQSERLAKVWLWGHWPGNGGRHETGIDLVAEER